MKFVYMIIFVMVVCNTSIAADLKKEMAKCASVEGELSRLDCYDKLADSIGVSKKKTTSQKKTGKWALEIKKNPIDDSKTIIGILTAQTGISNFGRPVTLILRCQSKQTEAFINWGSYLGDDSPQVLMRIGDAEASTETWNSSTDKTATFYGGDVVEFIKKLEGGKKFVAQITPYMENPITAVFDLAGIEKVIKPISETCDWEKPETISTDKNADSSQ